MYFQLLKNIWITVGRNPIVYYWPGLPHPPMRSTYTSLPPHPHLHQRWPAIFIWAWRIVALKSRTSNAFLALAFEIPSSISCASRFSVHTINLEWASERRVGRGEFVGGRRGGKVGQRTSTEAKAAAPSSPRPAPRQPSALPFASESTVGEGPLGGPRLGSAFFFSHPNACDVAAACEACS